MQLRINSFKNRVLEVVAGIPEGETRTYKQVAELAGSPRAARAVGNVMRGNKNPHVPCHRVVKSDGGLGGYNRPGGTETKRKILEGEGAL